MSKNFKTLLPLLLLAISVTAQKHHFKIPDTLKSKSIDYIITRIDQNEGNKFLDSIYANAYLQKSKKAKDAENTVKAYNLIMMKSPKEVTLQYCDTLISVAIHSKQNALIGSAYLTRGIIYNSLKQQTKALDNYLLANNFIAKTNDDYLINKVKFSIAQIKYHLGYYHESIALLKECAKYFGVWEPELPYLWTLYTLSQCYIDTKQPALAAATIDIGYRQAIAQDEPTMVSYFTNAEGRNEYFKGNFKLAITNLQESLPQITAREDYISTSATNYYIGRSYWALNEKDKAVPYFKKVDEVFRKDNFIKEDALEAYYLLADYYESRGNKTEQLKYLHQMLKAGEFVSKNFRYLSERMHRGYDMKKIAEKIKDLNQEAKLRNALNIMLTVLMLVMVFLVALIIYKRYGKEKIRQQRFKGVLTQKDRTLSPTALPIKISDGDTALKPEIVNSVSKKLDKFENSEIFLDKDFNLNKMAAFVDCNTRYTSRIICETRNKKYIEYIDDLRINYIVDRLKTDSKYRNYTIKALTEEAGFKSPQKFKEAFIKSTELTPVYFIKELKKQHTD